MIGLFWNCRGIRKKGLAPFIRDLMKERNFDFVCFQETILQSFSDLILRKIDPSTDYLWDWILVKGKSGGVLRGVRHERFDVGSRIQGSFILQLNMWDKLLNVKWNLLNAYGAAQDEHKVDFLTEMASMCSKCDVPFIIGGDFNILRYSSEKNKNFHQNRFSDLFNTIIHANELREIFVAGGKYTWSNNQRKPTLEKLDRILMTREWEIIFPAVNVHKIPREISDHNPLILSTSNFTPPVKQREFRFELSWLKSSEFLRKVQEIWNQPTGDDIALDRVQFKIKKIKKIFQRLGF